MVRGFVTLATGNIVYYKMAANLLASFKIHNPGVPFAIICDRTNKYTDMFDDVVVLEKANGNYIDKFLLLIKSPYDESIFIEPDCLIYRNLDFFWDMLSKESDCSSFGWNKGGLDCWFNTPEVRHSLFEAIPKIDDDTVVPIFNPGYIFIRKGSNCEKMYADCLEIAKIISEHPLLSVFPRLLCAGKLRDDPIFCVAMGMNGFVCHTVPEKSKCIALPSKYIINKIDIIEGKLNVTDKRGQNFDDCALLHFSTRKAAEEGLYLWQTILIELYNKNLKLHRLLNNKFFYGTCVIFRKIKTKIKHLIN